jgi:hypothetical protein
MSDLPRHHLVSSRKGVLIDANLLTVLLVGLLGAGEVERFKRTRSFTTKDAIGIDDLLRGFGWICTTPHVIAEVSNLLDWLDRDKRHRAFDLLAAFIRTRRELSIPATDIVESPVYLKLGITDAGLFIAARAQKLVLLTADLPLYHHASGLNLDAINFNHIREL